MARLCHAVGCLPWESYTPPSCHRLGPKAVPRSFSDICRACRPPSEAWKACTCHIFSITEESESETVRLDKLSFQTPWSRQPTYLTRPYPTMMTPLSLDSARGCDLLWLFQQLYLCLERRAWHRAKGLVRDIQLHLAWKP